MKMELLEYRDGSTILEAYVAYQPSMQHKPAVLISHAWAGRDQFACEKAKAIADLGYVGFALDMYGKGKLGSNNEENSNLMTPFIQDRELLKRRIQLALTTAVTLPFVDKNNIAAMGYCFGGMCVLDLARSGADIKGVISFHGLLDPPAQTQKIKAKVLVLHGDTDPMVPPSKVRGFQEEMTRAHADWQVHVYGNTSHAFTNPAATEAALGLLYNSVAEKRAWNSLITFLDECFI